MCRQPLDALQLAMTKPVPEWSDQHNKHEFLDACRSHLYKHGLPHGPGCLQQAFSIPMLISTIPAPPHLRARLDRVKNDAVAGDEQYHSIVEEVHAVPHICAQPKDMPAAEHTLTFLNCHVMVRHDQNIK